MEDGGSERAGVGGGAEPCGWPLLLLPRKLSAFDLQPFLAPYPYRREVEEKGQGVSGCEGGSDLEGRFLGAQIFKLVEGKFLVRQEAHL